jgi:murein DD-endopeptidase MepM/ murein hydrolase activator NlpD
VSSKPDKSGTAGATGARRRLARARRARAVVFIAAGFAALALSLAFLGVASGSTGPTTSVASGYVTRVGNGYAGGVAVTASLEANATQISAPARPPALAFTGGSTAVSAQVVARVLNSRATTTLADVSLLDGLVTATQVTVVAAATVDGHSSPAATTSGSVVCGLTVDGQAVTVTDQPVEIEGVGTLTVLVAASEASGDSSSAQVLGLRLVLSAPWRDLPAGSVLVAGQASATADRATLEALAPPPRPKPTVSPTTRPSPTPTAHPSQTTQDAQPTWPQDYAPMPPPQTSIGGLLDFPGAVFPVVAPYSYTDDWHAPRIGHLHQGNDIFAAWGTPLLAVQSGVISKMSDYGLGGISLHLANASGDYFYYAHLSRYAEGLHVGQHVAAGEVIGYVGNTGDAATTPSHLHFEIHPGGGAPVDPFLYLELWRAGATAPVALNVAPPAAPVGVPQTAPRPRQVLLALAPGPVGALSQPWFERLASPFPDPSDPSSTFPLVVLVAVGTAVVKRIQWMARPF